MVDSDRVAPGSEYCFDMGHEEPVKIIERSTRMAANDHDLIPGGNAAHMPGVV